MNWCHILARAVDHLLAGQFGAESKQDSRTFEDWKLQEKYSCILFCKAYLYRHLREVFRSKAMS
jgi:hypothetical protein